MKSLKLNSLFLLQDPDSLTIANGIFSDKTFELSADYESQARNYLKSEVKRLDFGGNPLAGESEINEWASKKTNGKITQLFDHGNYGTNSYTKYEYNIG